MLVKRVVAVAGEVFPSDGGRVPDGCFAVSGDNPVSVDSRRLGAICQRDLLGIVARSRRILT